MLDNRFRRVVVVTLLVVMAALALEGCAKPRKKKKKKKFIPTTEMIAEWVKKYRHSNFNMVQVPPGQYFLGDNTFKGNRERRIKLEEPFWIDKFEATNHDWFMYLWANKGSENIDYLGAAPQIKGDFATDGWLEWDKDFQYDYEGRNKHPIRAVGYDEAKGYAKFVKKRLPTADEWEIAARGPKGLRYPWGNTYKKADWKTKAWTSFMMSMETTGHADRSTIEWLNDTIPVDKLAAGQSAFGCYGMAGNVSEWTTSQVPTGHGVWKKKRKKDRPMAQVVKGGSFFQRQKGTLAAQFFELLPSTATDVFRVGFRCARD